MPNVWRLWLVRPEIDCAAYREHVADPLKDPDTLLGNTDS